MRQLLPIHRTCVRRVIRGIACGAVLGTCISVSVSAAPPINPTPMPFYSFDAESPQSQAGVFGPADILIIEPPVPTPRVDVPGASLGLGLPDDELDALALPRGDTTPTTPFALLFSVDRATVGNAAPDAALVELKVPYNVTDQANRGQAAGDQFMSLAICRLATGCTVNRRALLANNVLNRNNYDEGGTDFSAAPSTSAEDDASGSPQDNVDATAASSVMARALEVFNVYFSVASPPRSRAQGSSAADYAGADILFNADPLDAAGETMVYGSHVDFGLQPFDDIDAMIVFDTDGDGMFNGTDTVLFSLSVDSPSLGIITGASQVGAAADVFSVTPGSAPTLFVSAAQLGMGQSSDNIDALDLLWCDDANSCAAERGIRKLPVPAMSQWGLAVLTLLLVATGTVVIRRRTQPAST